MEGFEDLDLDGLAGEDNPLHWSELKSWAVEHPVEIKAIQTVLASVGAIFPRVRASTATINAVLEAIRRE